jgi:hypothetical protein
MYRDIEKGIDGDIFCGRGEGSQWIEASGADKVKGPAASCGALHWTFYVHGNAMALPHLMIVQYAAASDRLPASNFCKMLWT